MIECLITIIPAVIISLATSMGCAGADGISKPGCPNECGGIQIPFPFGIGDGCYLPTNLPNVTYQINCEYNNTTPPIPFLVNNNTMIKSEVLNINLTDHTLRVSSGVAYECYQNGAPIPSTTPNSTYRLQDLRPFNLSETKNRLVAIGCDTIARIRESSSSDHELAHPTGCMASCYSTSFMRNGTCSGAGCCEAYMISMHQPLISVDSLSNHSGVEYNPCNYAFVGEVGSYNFSVANLTAALKDFDKMRFPVVYDWSVTSPGENGPLICGSNAQRVDGFDNGWRYRCQCLKGYTGNPYLPQGCQDINECADPGLNDCQFQEYCVNKDGGYVCKCAKHYEGPGNGTRSDPCLYQTPSTLGFGEFATNNGSSVAMTSVISFTVAICVFICFLYQRRRGRKERQHNFRKNGGLLLHQQIFANEGVVNTTKIFSRNELEKATHYFSNNRVLGTGGQGTVYKGILTDGTIVAIKKSKKVDKNCLAQFINEVVILSQVNHRNVVKLFGCCLETEVPWLVYEFVPNGTLYQHIHRPREDFRMTWKVRFQIALDCAGAVAYLHSSCSSPIYHRDIKSSNILLDENYKSKVADFGTSKTISIDKTHMTTCVQGTFGYIDPEFFRSRQFNEKSDVYSFGVVLLELITSKKPIFTSTTSSEHRGLASEFIQLIETSPDQLDDILDNEVLQNCSEEEIEALTKLIKRCLNMNGKRRPTMREVALALEMIKSRHDEEATPSAEEGEWVEGMDQMGIIIEGASDSSTYNDTSYSMNLQPFVI